MARCPNCGRETRRTVDWCCQWCGYPLFSGSYKKIDKTYKELKDERTTALSDDDKKDREAKFVVESVIEEEYEEELEEEEPEVEEKPVQRPKVVRKVRPEPKPKIAPRRRRQIVKKRRPEPEPEPESEIEEDEEYEEEEYENDEYEEEYEDEYEDEDEYDEELEDEEEIEEEENEEENTTVIEEPVMELTVDELISAYETEGPKADAKFTNKILRVTGTIARIDVREAQALFSLTLEAQGASPLQQSVRCIFSREHGNELQQLVRSQTVTVQGKYDGSIINISMRDCRLV